MYCDSFFTESNIPKAQYEVVAERITNSHPHFSSGCLQVESVGKTVNLTSSGERKFPERFHRQPPVIVHLHQQDEYKLLECYCGACRQP